MGAREFQVVGRGPNVERAFWTEVAKALSTYGDTGYTGTIAEKYEYLVFDRDGLASAGDIARWALSVAYRESDSAVPPSATDLVREISEVVRDKWGPAAAIELAPHETGDAPGRDGEHAYLFFGTSSY